MIPWLRLIQRDLEKITDEEVAAIEPDGEGCEHDHVVGVVPKDLRRLRFLLLRYGQRARQAHAARLTLRGKKREAKTVELVKYHRCAEVLGELFWISLRHKFPALWDKDSIGLRTGWRVVWTEHEVHIVDGHSIVDSLFEALRQAASDEDPDEARTTKPPPIN